MKQTVPNSHATSQATECRLVKNISNHPIGLALIESSFETACDYPASILSAVLEKRETFVGLRCAIEARVVKEEPKYSAHCTLFHQSFL